LVIDGLAVGVLGPKSAGPPTITTPASVLAEALGRFAVALVPLPLALPTLPVTTGAPVLAPLSATRSTIVLPLFPKLTVIVPDPLALEEETK
jgi:hypothetical protein